MRKILQTIWSPLKHHEPSKQTAVIGCIVTFAILFFLYHYLPHLSAPSSPARTSFPKEIITNLESLLKNGKNAKTPANGKPSAQLIPTAIPLPRDANGQFAAKDLAHRAIAELDARHKPDGTYALAPVDEAHCQETANANEASFCPANLPSTDEVNSSVALARLEYYQQFTNDPIDLEKAEQDARVVMDYCRSRTLTCPGATQVMNALSKATGKTLYQDFLHESANYASTDNGVAVQSPETAPTTPPPPIDTSAVNSRSLSTLALTNLIQRLSLEPEQSYGASDAEITSLSYPRRSQPAGICGVKTVFIDESLSLGTFGATLQLTNTASEAKTVEGLWFGCVCDRGSGDSTDPSRVDRGVCEVNCRDIVRETYTLSPNGTQTVTKNISQNNNAQCGALQLDFKMEKVNGEASCTGDTRRIVGDVYISGITCPATSPSPAPTSIPTPTSTPAPLACNQPCNLNDNKCPTEGCSLCLPGSDGKTVCTGPSPTASPTATPTPSPTATPTPRPPACGEPCSPYNNQCPAGTPDKPDCSACLPRPNEGGTICQSQPSITPTVTPTGLPSLTPTTTPTTTPVITPTVTPTPTPNCKCDGVDYQIGDQAANTGNFERGIRTRFTAFGKVPANTNGKVIALTFHFQRATDDPLNPWQDVVKEKVSASSISTPAGKDTAFRYYSATWYYTISTDRNVVPSGRYRVIVPTTTSEDFTCGYQTAQRNNSTIFVLGSSTTASPNVIESILGFFRQFFSGKSSTQNATSPTPTATPATSAGTQSVLVPQGARSLQLGTFNFASPTPSIIKECTSVEFTL